MTGAQSVLVELKQSVLQNEADQLHFTSVANASCSSPSDEARLRAAICGQEGQIDGMITTLRAVGAYDEVVRDDIQRGLNPADGRRLDFSQLALVCFFSGFSFTLVEVRLSSPLGYWYRQAPAAVAVATVLLPAALVLLSAFVRAPRQRSAVYALTCLSRGACGLVAQFLAIGFLHRGARCLSRRTYHSFFAWSVHTEYLVVVTLLLLGPEGLSVARRGGARVWAALFASAALLWQLFSLLSVSEPWWNGRARTRRDAFQWTAEVGALLGLWILVWIGLKRHPCSRSVSSKNQVLLPLRQRGSKG